MRLSALWVLAGWSAAAALWPAAASADDWAELVAKAKQEGAVVVHGAPGKTYNTALVAAFNKTYPEIKVQFSGAANAVDMPKVLRERQADIYGWDVWISGPSTAVGVLKQAGFFDPLPPVLRRDLTDDSKWINGFESGWMDIGHQIFYSFDGTIQNPVLVNWDVMPPSRFTSLAELAKPEFAGKIVMHDPRVNGSGSGSSQTLFRNVGEAALRKIYKNQVTYTMNGHQIAEWVIRGRYPIGLGLEENDLKEFQAQGLGKNIRPAPDNYFKIQQISSGFGGIGLVNRAPHPAAARVYINWVLSKDGQEAWVKVPRNSRRTDVEPAFPELSPKAGNNYFNGQEEQYNKERLRLMEVAKEEIDGITPRSGAAKQ
jgi:iron(III) transport system substrate-binding protein